MQIGLAWANWAHAQDGMGRMQGDWMLSRGKIVRVEDSGT